MFSSAIPVSGTIREHRATRVGGGAKPCWRREHHMTRVADTWPALCTSWCSEHCAYTISLTPHSNPMKCVLSSSPLQMRKWYRWGAKGLKSLSKITEVNGRAGIWTQIRRCQRPGAKQPPCVTSPASTGRDQLFTQHKCARASLVPKADPVPVLAGCQSYGFMWPWTDYSNPLKFLIGKLRITIPNLKGRYYWKNSVK